MGLFLYSLYDLECEENAEVGLGGGGEGVGDLFYFLVGT